MNSQVLNNSNKYTFNAVASRTWDFICLPLISNKNLESLDPKEIDVYSKIKDPEYKQMLKELKSSLEPYASEIKKYYFEEDTPIVNLLNIKINFFDFKDLFEFLDECLTKSVSDLRTSILYATFAREAFAGFQDEIWKQAASVVDNSSEYMTILNDYELAAETKWHLLTFLQTPYAVINQYADFMRQIEPIFNEFYKPYEEKLQTDGQVFIDELLSLGENPISALSQGILNDNLIPEGPITVLYSYTNAYAISLYPSVRAPYIVWGSEVDKVLSLMKDHFEEKQSERLQMFKNLGDKTRYDVLKCVANGITSTKVIAEQLGVTSATISYHLSSLTSVKLILLSQQDKKLIQTLNKDLMREHIEALKTDFGL